MRSYYSRNYLRPNQGQSTWKSKTNLRSSQYSRPKMSKEVVYGYVATYQPKKFGFITPDLGGKDVFFSSKALPDHLRTTIQSGTQVKFIRSLDPNGKPCAAEIDRVNNGRPSIPHRFRTPNQPNMIQSQRQPDPNPTLTSRPGPKLIRKKAMSAPLTKVLQSEKQSDSSATASTSRDNEEPVPAALTSLTEDKSITLSNLQEEAPIKLPGTDVPSFDWVKMPDDNGETPGTAYAGSLDSDVLRSDFSGYTFPPNEDEGESEQERGEENVTETKSETSNEGQSTPSTITGFSTSIHDLTNELVPESPSVDARFTRNGKAKSEIPCRYHGSARGCSKQGDCLYSHDEPWAIRLCDAVSHKTICEYGDECRFRHKRLPQDAYLPMKPRKTRRNRTTGPKRGTAPQLRNEWTFNTKDVAFSTSAKHDSATYLASSRVDEKEDCSTPFKSTRKMSLTTDTDFQPKQNFARFEEQLRHEDNGKLRCARSWIPGSESPPPRDQIKKFGLRSWYSNGSSSSRS